MADELVLRAQKFINTYNVDGIPTVIEDGVTGWGTMYALTRCLQHELGLTSLSNNFGPGTLAALETKYPKLNANTVPSANFCRIIQSALYCKGYDGGEIDGKYNERVSTAVSKLKADMSVTNAYPDDYITPKVFKGLLNMDAYTTVDGGSSRVRIVQQLLNRRYVTRKDFYVIPCDGRHSRDVAKSMLLAIQYELGMPDGVANGVFGPGTQGGLKEHPVSLGSTGVWVQLFTAGMILNHRNIPLTSTFTDEVRNAVSAFQEFTMLTPTGQGDFQTWASLLVSTGDPSRKGAASDCVTTITPARAKTLRDNGYRYVGRYLSNVPGSSLDKEIKPGELDTIAAYGLRCFPIYQTYGASAGYFHDTQGTVDAYAAIHRAAHYGFKPGTRIFFAVDFDALDHEVTSNIIPHFEAIRRVLAADGRYRVGIYGARNVCTRVHREGLSKASFVSDMSTGFSGNLGYALPSDWAYDQIATITIGSGDGAIEIDKNIASGRDEGQNSFDPPLSTEPDGQFDASRRPALLEDIQVYLESEGLPERGGGIEGMVQIYSTTEAFNLLMEHDYIITAVAKKMRIRKAMVMCPLLWEIRKLQTLDFTFDNGVVTYHTFADYDPTDKYIKRDSSTGLGQVFAGTAIKARNHLIDKGRITASVKNPDNDDDIWEIWQKLNGEQYTRNTYNIHHVAYALMHAGAMMGRGLPTLDYSYESTRLCFQRYRGEDDVAVRDGHTQLGLYHVIEKHFAPLR
ncbi:glycoside hydrolase domain-containing protein [Streptomyces apocyni]|uniref:glycoside hydrolase domain-containing protein n=1 Tax=Streptomyces apocyni TaxID=2654677 RepID=UPI0012EA34BF|nr:glycoside hydrolase domain-containing protein [Streptomyces apocyni]